MEAVLTLFVLFTLLAVASFYWVFLRPVLKQQQRHRRDIADLRPGDRVLTVAGFLATVREIRVPESGATEIVLDLGNGVQVTAIPAAISQRLVAATRLPTAALSPGQSPKGEA